jgi:hypothetical protein
MPVQGPEDMVHQQDGNDSEFGSEQEIRVLLDTYVDGGLDEEQLIDQLVQIRDMAPDELSDQLATELSELVARIEMIHLNICRAEQQHAIFDVLAEFKKNRLDAAK